MISSPAISNKNKVIANKNDNVDWHLLEQYSILVPILLSIGILGDHNGAFDVRIFDALFVLISGWACVIFMKSCHLGLLGALFAYNGVRIVRSGMFHSYEVTHFTVYGHSFNTPGYAISDSLISTSNTFGGAVCLASGLIILAHISKINVNDLFSVSFIIGMNATLAFGAALASQIAAFSRIDNLPTLFSEIACTENRDVCPAATRGRRMFMSNTSTASLWCSVIALSIFAIPRNTQRKSRGEYYTKSTLTVVSGSTSAIVTAVTISIVYAFGNYDTVLPQSQVLFLYTSVPMAWFVSIPMAAACNVAGNLLYFADRFGDPTGVDLMYFTHWCMVCSAAFVSALTITTLISWVCWQCGRWCVPIFEELTCMLITATLSIQFVLTLLTLGLVVSYNGGDLLGGGKHIHGSKIGFEFTAQHSITFFFIATVYTSRYEFGLPKSNLTVRRIVWYTSAPLVGVCWIMTMLIRNEPSPYDSQSSWLSLSICILATFVSWLALGVAI
tara:strand:- start:1372 stop:2874 length:1503 start_codon:yes stop_codon:yes gene_type:complete